MDGDDPASQIKQILSPAIHVHRILSEEGSHETALIKKCDTKLSKGSSSDLFIIPKLSRYARH